MKKVSQAMLDGLAKVSGEAGGLMYNAGSDCACAEGCAYIGFGIPKELLAGVFFYVDTDSEVAEAMWGARGAFKERTGLSLTQAMDAHGYGVAKIAIVLAAEGY